MAEAPELKVGAPNGRALPQPQPLAFIETSKIAARVRASEPWQQLMKRVYKVGALYNNLKHNEQTKAAAMASLCSVNILPMPVCVSPFAVALGQHNGQMSPLYVSAFTSLYELHMLRIFMKEVCYSRDKETPLYMAMQKLDEALERDLGASQVTLKTRLDQEVYFPLRDKEINDATAVFLFVQALEEQTFYVLNRYEAYLYDGLCLGVPEDEGPPVIQLANVLTERGVKPTGMDMLSLDNQGRQWEVLVRTCEKVLSLRTQLWNERMRRAREQRGDPPHQDVLLFNTENLVTRIRDALQAAQVEPRQNRLYRGWLLFDTAREFCNLLNMQFVTEQQLLERAASQN